MIVYIYDENENKIEKHNLNFNDCLPYVTNNNLTVKQFVKDTQTNILWTTKRFLENYDSVIECEFEIKEGFRRGWQTVENGFYTHKLGTALQGGENLSFYNRLNLLKQMEDEELFEYIHDLEHAPNTMRFYQNVSLENQLIPFKTIELNQLGPEVFVLQDCLWMLGYDICAIHGEFDKNLENAVKLFQRNHGLVDDGVVGGATWIKLFQLIHPEDERLFAEID